MKPADLAPFLARGARVYMSAGSAEPTALASLFAEAPELLAGIEIAGSFVPGVNRTDYAGYHADARMLTLLLPPEARASFEAGRVRILPLSYTGMARHLENRPVDVALVHVTPPDAGGWMTLGPAADFAPIAIRAAAASVALVNPDLPRPPGGHRVHRSQFVAALDCEGHAPGIAVAPPSPTLAAIAGHTAALIADGDTVQAGLGGAPSAALTALTSHRDIRIYSGMISDEAMLLAGAGALANEGHVAGIAIGSADFYRWLGHAEGIALRDTFTTHGAAALAGVRGLAAINSALEVDLFGQANLEWREGRLVSGVGGAPDFIAGARLSRGGRSIIALPSTAKGKSRIVPRLDAPTVSIPRSAIDTVVTEHGTAHIRDLSVELRAQELIGIAAPEHRAVLQQDWETIRDRF